MDLDGDGRLDILSGSYPGEIYLFRGQEDGSYAESKQVVDAEGEVVKVGRAAAAFAADWDRDGDLDLVIGDIGGAVWLLSGQSGNAALSLGEAKKVEVGEGTIRVPGGDAGPVLADWDGNGTLDLIVGCGDGSVRFYANANREGKPDLAAPVILLASKGPMNIGPEDPVRRGSRVKPCVVDFDGDGRLDLLLGDVIAVEKPARGMSAEDRAEKAKAEAMLRWIQARHAPALARVREEVCAGFGIDGAAFDDAWEKMSEEEKQRYRDVQSERLKRDVEASALMRMMQDVRKRLRRYQTGSDIHGHVWVMLRAAD